jgi:large subunit ribosomal protein L19
LSINQDVGSIKVIRSGRVRRAKLYYLRGKKGKSARITEKIKKTIGADVSEQINENEILKENITNVNQTKEEPKQDSAPKAELKKDNK